MLIQEFVLIMYSARAENCRQLKFDEDPCCALTIFTMNPGDDSERPICNVLCFLFIDLAFQKPRSEYGYTDNNH